MAGEQAEYLTPTEVAKLLLVSPVTVRQWAQKGMIPAQTTAGGHRRFLRTDIEHFARLKGMTLPNSELTVLVVDDDRQLNAFLVSLLTTSLVGLQVVSAFDGFEAGKIVQQDRPEVVLLDIMMPGMDGVQVCRSIKQDPDTAHARVVGMTGHHSDNIEHRITEAGAVGLLRKPFSSEDLFNLAGLTHLQPDLV